MPYFTANIIVPKNFELQAFAKMMRHVGFEVQVVPQAHGLVAQKRARSLEDFLEELDAELAPFRDAIVDDFGPAARIT